MSDFEILAVCLGNICRSPMAVAVLRDRIAAARLDDRVTVSSAGTGSWHIGRDADPRARETLRLGGYEFPHRARQITSDWVRRSDLVLAMDRWNMQDVREVAPACADVTRIRLLRSFDPELTHLPEDDERLDVPDPYYGDADDFRQALRQIENAVTGVVDHVRLELGT